MVKSQTLKQAQALLQEVEMTKIELRQTDKSPFYQARFYINGRRYERSTKETNKRLASQVAKDVAYEILARTKYPQTLGAHTFEEAVERRIEEGISINDRGYLKWFKKELRGVLVSEIDKDTIWKLKQKYRKQADAKQKAKGKPPIKNQSVNRVFNVLHGTLSMCDKEWDWLEHSPKNLKLTEAPPKQKRILAKNEMKKIKRACLEIGKPYIYDILYFYVLTGFRKEELFQIKKGHIDLDFGTLLIPDQKNDDKNQTIYLNSEALKIAKKQMSSKGEMLFNGTNFRKIWNKVRDVAEIKNFVIHSFKHTATTNVAKHCKNREELKAFTRHKSDAGLKPYLHLIEEEDNKRIAELSTSWSKE